MLAEAEAVDEHDQPAPVAQRAGAQVGQPLGGGGDKPAGDDRFGGTGGGLGDRLPDRLEPVAVAA
ncbi:MAG: hypothetical protein M3276_04545, partial [Actinomycetota bacterium]|nr:hypothetical protein [Actinomycetota bacterium]